MAGERGGPEIRGAPTPSWSRVRGRGLPFPVVVTTSSIQAAGLLGLETCSRRASRELGWATPGGPIALVTAPAVVIAPRGSAVVALLVLLLTRVTVVRTAPAAPFATPDCWGGPACWRCPLTVPRVLQSSTPCIIYGSKAAGHLSNRNGLCSDVSPEALVVLNGEVSAALRRQLGQDDEVFGGDGES